MDQKEYIPQQIDIDFIVLRGWEFNISYNLW